MEPNIKAGTLWCPSAEGNIETSKQKGQQEDSAVCQQFFFHSTEKEIAIEASGSSTSISTGNDTGMNITETSFCCAGDYCWKEDNPRNFTVTSTMCNLLCHEYCSKVSEVTNLRYVSNVLEHKL